MCRPHFCSMKITEDVRRYAQKQGISEDDALPVALEQEACDFHEEGVSSQRPFEKFLKVMPHLGTTCLCEGGD
jgi:hypothetical protein